MSEQEQKKTPNTGKGGKKTDKKDGKPKEELGIDISDDVLDALTPVIKKARALAKSYKTKGGQ